ncbi:hypothetical protein IB236_22955 [Acidovorax sp. ACV02]|uniref:hypothetical protein n=1 Tax=Acidovorax sp. ACV02 TaxID=2769310 RepID=UPI001786C72D|nr:hypothetical protein [Acidovorax sp. ACV02]MBD9408205.1 hypothetical protein [Acidovorax sp. ACV02]
MILTLPVGATNAGEWAKKDACWDRARDASQEPTPDSTWLVSRAEARYKQTEARKQGKQDDVIALQRRMLALCESGYWAELSKWSGLHEIATEAQQMLVVRASTISGFMKIGLERDWTRLSELAKSCDEAGFKRPMETLSKQL